MARFHPEPSIRRNQALDFLHQARASCRSAMLPIPDDVVILPQPPKRRELNPAENVWRFLRDDWLSNRVVKCLDDVVDHCRHAWSKLIDQPWRIMSIGLRDRAHAFQSTDLDKWRGEPTGWAK